MLIEDLWNTDLFIMLIEGLWVFDIIRVSDLSAHGVELASGHVSRFLVHPRDVREIGLELGHDGVQQCVRLPQRGNITWYIC